MQKLNKDQLIKELEEQLGYVKATPAKKAAQFYKGKTKHDCFIAGFEIALEFIKEREKEDDHV